MTEDGSGRFIFKGGKMESTKLIVSKRVYSPRLSSFIYFIFKLILYEISKIKTLLFTAGFLHFGTFIRIAHQLLF
ncbi:hypothetical protein EGI15_08300 [Chryseobacterium cucumeris]|uniref:Uncharacterized protein n=1 Tax=Chryseobacterium cucumeris TaxID=1813611 RepID=A0ABX9X5P4_9FLAO|nr:hypothetical protein EGI15_08300 [Chryseobacterium cucumeris]